MKTSYDFMTSNIKSLVKKTWRQNLPLAILMAVVFYFLLPNKSLHDWGIENPMASFVVQTIVYAATIVWAIVAICHILPLHKKAKGEKRKTGKSVLRIFKHFGGFLATCFLGCMILCIVIFIAALPSLIITMAQLQSQLGALEGDTLGVPGYFTLLLFLVFIITNILIVYAMDWLLITLSYQYGSYQVTDEEKRKIKESKMLATE